MICFWKYMEQVRQKEENKSVEVHLGRLGNDMKLSFPLQNNLLCVTCVKINECGLALLGSLIEGPHICSQSCFS